MRETIPRRRAERDIMKNPHGIEAMKGEEGELEDASLKEMEYSPLT